MDKQSDLSVASYGDVRAAGQYSVALLPWGATEPHNYHLPYLTDCILAHDVALDAARLALADFGVRCVVLPPVACGSQNPGQRELPFCLHFRYETQRAVLADTVASLSAQGVGKLLIVNGHGGNNFKNMIRDLRLDFPGFLVATSEWFKMAPPRDFFEVVGDHADEVETSVMMHYHPELVSLADAGPGLGRPFRPDALRDGSVWTPRNWALVTPDTGIGDPSRSSADKGRRFAEAVAARYARFLSEFAAAASEADLY